MKSLRVLLWALALAVVLAGAAGGWWYASQPLLEVFHAPERIGPRSGFVTANLTGRLGDIVGEARYRVNNGAWMPIAERPPRVRRPDFTVELLESELRPGANTIELEAQAPLRATRRAEYRIDYDPTPPTLPTKVIWGATPLDVHDGRWEVITGPDGAPWVRSVPGYEGWDRLALALPPFRGGRRVTVDVRLTAVPDTGQRDWGFGLFPLWGGRPDPSGVHPLMGWRFALAWYSRHEGGFTAGMSEKLGTDGVAEGIVEKLRGSVEPGVTYRVLVEVRELRRADGSFVGWTERMKWWPARDAEPAHWIEIEDLTGMILPDEDYAVAVFSLRTPAEFGPVMVEALPPQTVP